MPTIKDVAELAGVAVGTVSHVITGSVPVSEPLRLKVLAAIRQLDYHPNLVARSLKTSRTSTIGIIVPDLTISFFPHVIQGAEAAGRGAGYSLIAVTSNDDAARQRELLSLLRSQRVEGVLLVLAAAPTPTTQILRMIEAGVQVVCLDRIPDMALDSVSVLDDKAACMGVEHLIARGHRRIAIVTGPLTLKNERGRIAGYKKALDESGIPFDEDLVWRGNLKPDGVAALCSARLSNGARRPDAIFATNGPTGLGVLRAFRDCGLSTPGDIAFATFDELAVDDLFQPSITTVVQPAFEIGFQAAEILLHRIRNAAVPSKPLIVKLPATLQVRASSGAANVPSGARPPARKRTRASIAS